MVTPLNKDQNLCHIVLLLESPPARLPIFQGTKVSATLKLLHMKSNKKAVVLGDGATIGVGGKGLNSALVDKWAIRGKNSGKLKKNLCFLGS